MLDVRYITLKMIAAISVALQTGLVSPVQIQQDVHTLVSQAISDVDTMDALHTELQEYLSAHTSADAYWDVSVMLPASRVSFTIDPNEEMTAASSIKLFVVGAAMEQWDSLDIDTAELEHLMASCMIISDNDAATALVSLLGQGDTTKGKEVVNAFCKAHGYEDTYLGILFTGVDPTGTYNATSSRDTAAFMSDLARYDLEGAGMMVDWMLESERKNKIPEGLPTGISNANKTGELNNTENDACIVYGNNRTYVLSVMADNVDPAAAVDTIREISAIVYERLDAS